MNKKPERAADLRELIGITDFRRLWLGQILSNTGDNLTFISLFFLVQRLTGSTVALAGLAMAAAIPALVLGPISGVFVDRWDRRRVMITSDILRATIVLGFVWIRTADLIWLIYLLTFVQGSLGTLFLPARMALLPHLVGEKRLLAANSVSQTSETIFRLVGTAAAGLLAGTLDHIWPAFAIDAGTFLLSAVLVAGITAKAQDSTPTDPDRTDTVGDHLSEGFRVIRRSRPLIGVTVARGIAMLGIGAFNVLLIPFVVEDLSVSESWFGLVEGSLVIGMIVSGVFVAVLASRIKPARIVGYGLAITGSLIGLVSVTRSIWMLMAVLAAVGLSITPVQASTSTLTQTLVPDNLRGRVSGFIGSISSGTAVISMGLSGVAVAAIGVRGVFAVSGGITAAAGAAAWLLLRGEEAAQGPQ